MDKVEEEMEYILQENAQKGLDEVLDETFSDEVFIVGSSAIDNLINGHTKLSRAKEGSNLDTSAAIELLSASIGLLTALIQFYIIFREAKKKEPTIVELQEEVSNRKIDVSSLTSEQSELLIKALVAELSKPK